MKAVTILIMSLLLSNLAFSQSSTSQSGVDPLDNYIDPATLLDYKTQFKKLNDAQKSVLFDRCHMFTIQNEMGQTGEASMTPTEIDAYEKLIEKKCSCIQDGHTWVKESLTSGRCDTGTENEKDILLYTLDQCVDRLKISEKNCKDNMSDNCVNNFRYQCYQFITQTQEFSEPQNPRLNRCNFDDQTKIIKKSCRSYCYIYNTCDVEEVEFKDREIANIYLLKQKSRSSCIKGTSFGIKDDNTIWVTQSCDGDFGLQYKDPKCGYRPYCTPRPHQIDSIPDGGTQKIEMLCNGEENEEGGKRFCKIEPKKLDENGKLTDVVDPNKVVSYVSNVKLVKKIGAATCNPGGNAASIDWGAADKGLDGGWQIFAKNMCNGVFQVSFNWKRKLCTLAGEKGTKDTCCNGLVFDDKTKTCHAPMLTTPSLEDLDRIKLEGEKCSAKLAGISTGQSPLEVDTFMERYYAELGVFERLFTLIAGESDAATKALNINREDPTKLPTSDRRDARYDSTQKIHNAFILFRDRYQKVKNLYDSVTKMKAETAKEYLAFLENGGETKHTTGQVEALRKKDNFDTDFVRLANELFQLGIPEAYIGSYYESSRAGFQYLGKGFFSHTFQSAAKYFQVSDMLDMRGYLAVLYHLYDRLMFDMENSVQIGSDHLWYCAHKEDCSKRNWIVLDKTNEAVGDFFHEPVYAYAFNSPKIPSLGRYLPKLTDAKKYLFDLNKFDNMEKVLSSINEYQTIMNYGRSEFVTLPEKPNQTIDDLELISLFRKYAMEFPRRDNSKLKTVTALNDYKNMSKEKLSLPQYCEKQKDWQVRVPLGKVVEPMRIVQVLEVIRKYQMEGKKLLEERVSCLLDVNIDNDRTNLIDTSNNDLVSGGLTQTSGETPTVSAQEASGAVSPQFVENLAVAYPSLSTFSYNWKKTNSSSSAGVGNIQSATLSGEISGDLSALRRDKQERMRKIISKRIKTKGDKTLEKYMDSLDNSIGSALSQKKNLLAARGQDYNNMISLSAAKNASDLSGSSSNSSENDNKGTLGSSLSSALSGKWNFGGSGDSGLYGAGSGSSRGSYNSGSKSRIGGTAGQNGNSNGVGDTKGGVNGYASGKSNAYSDESKRMLNHINDRKYENKDSDSIFEKITKRYFKSAYPDLLKDKK